MLSLLFSACSEESSESANSQPSVTDDFAGLWSLHIMEQQDSITGEWKEWRDGMQGYIMYDGDENMSVHLTTRGYEKSPLVFPNFQDTISVEAMKHLTNSYVYFAKYTVDDMNSTVQHARISHSNPAEWNDVVVRRYEFKGDTLILQPVETQNAGLRLKWVKDAPSK